MLEFTTPHEQPTARHVSSYAYSLLAPETDRLETISWVDRNSNGKT